MLSRFSLLHVVASLHGIAGAPAGEQSGFGSLTAPSLVPDVTRLNVSLSTGAAFNPAWSCAKAPNTAPQLDFSRWCPSGSDGCWPPLYLLGVQKAATTSVAQALIACGVVTFGMPDKITGSISDCEGENIPCKETLHPPIDVTKADGQRRFAHLYSTSRCGDIVDSSWLQGAKEACYAGRFLEATPLHMVGSPRVSVLLQAMPPQFASRARYAIILREPVSRALSWYNHVVVGGDYYGDDPSHYSSFETFFNYVMNSGADTFEHGKYVSWLREFDAARHVARSQLLVLGFEGLLSEPAKTMKTITAHYGLPDVLTNMQALPEENTRAPPQLLSKPRPACRNAPQHLRSAASLTHRARGSRLP